MRILIIRHAEPDYAHDALTEKGEREAALLAERLCRIPITACYISTMGRACKTAIPTLRKFGISLPDRLDLPDPGHSKDDPFSKCFPAPQVHLCDWLQEFPHLIERPDKPGEVSIVWDWLPQDWTREDAFYDRITWADPEVMKKGCVKETYDKIITSFDAALASHGYIRNGNLYQAVHSNRDILAIFCHFGLECILLSHLLNVSPMILWHSTCALPSAVTSLYTEERRKGIAIFRMDAFGDLSHLYAGKEAPSFAARFCETFDHEEERHD